MPISGSSGSRGSGNEPAQSIPKSQRYYWTSSWQRHESLAVEELRRGEGRVFSDMTAAIAWLDADD